MDQVDLNGLVACFRIDIGYNTVWSKLYALDGTVHETCSYLVEVTDLIFFADQDPLQGICDSNSLSQLTGHALCIGHGIQFCQGTDVSLIVNKFVIEYAGKYNAEDEKNKKGQ